MTLSRLLRPHLGWLALLVVVAVACGDDVPDEYSAETRTAMVTACAEDDTDPDLLEVCECTYDTAEDQVEFADFAQLEDRLAGGEARLSGEVVGIIRDCIRSVSATR